MRRLFLVILPLAGVLIGLGALGHSFGGRRHVDAELAKYPLDPNVGTMLYVVWYFVGGCMALFGIVIIRAWYRLRQGKHASLFVVGLIGLLYFATGLGGFIYRHGDPFHLFFVALGALLLLSNLVLSPGTEVPQR
jgi:hypothetical protein